MGAGDEVRHGFEGVAQNPMIHVINGGVLAQVLWRVGGGREGGRRHDDHRHAYIPVYVWS